MKTKFISKYMPVCKLVEDYGTEVLETINQYGLLPAGCGIAANITIKDDAIAKGLNYKQLDHLVEKFNRLLNKRKKWQTQK